MNGGSQSFNVVNILRVLGRWMRMITVPNQSSVPKAWTEFDEKGTVRVWCGVVWCALHWGCACLGASWR